MLPDNWTPPCGKRCTKKYASVLQIPWRVFCKKGCDADGEDWEECIEECNEICYKDPVLKDHQWSAYIDRSPGAESHSLECFRACVSGCGYKFDMEPEMVDSIQPNRPLKPPLPAQEDKSGSAQPLFPAAAKPSSGAKKDDIPSTSA